MACWALGEGPSGFSLEASLMAVRPSSRSFFHRLAGRVGPDTAREGWEYFVNDGSWHGVFAVASA